MNRFVLVLMLTGVSASAWACSCVAPPENSVLYARASVLVGAEIVKVLERVSFSGQMMANQVEAKIVKIYKGDPSLIGKKVKLTGNPNKGNCSYFPPSQIGAKVTLQGPEPYQWGGGCHYVWSPEEK